jgi:hypothetical protein
VSDPQDTTVPSARKARPWSLPKETIGVAAFAPPKQAEINAKPHRRRKDRFELVRIDR